MQCCYSSNRSVCTYHGLIRWPHHVSPRAGAVTIGMLIIGRIILGFGVGLACQAVPLYLALRDGTA